VQISRLSDIPRPTGRGVPLRVEKTDGAFFRLVKRRVVHGFGDLAAPGLRSPLLCIIDGNLGAGRAVGEVWACIWAKRCPGVVTSLRDGGSEFLTFFPLPRAQSKMLRTTNVIERLCEEFRRRVKMQGSLPGEEVAVVLLFSLIVSGQIKLHKIDGWRKIAAVLSQHTPVVA